MPPYGHLGFRSERSTQKELDPVVEYRVYALSMGTQKSEKLKVTVETMTIGQVAKLSGIGIETIRFYEREGLIEEPARRESGYREYTNEVVTRLTFIKRAQELGFSLGEIGELLSLKLHPKGSCAEVRKRAEGKVTDIDTKIRDLQRMKKALMSLIASCVASRPITECPILEAFAAKEI